MSINKENFRALLLDIGFEKVGMFDRYRRGFEVADAELVADFDASTLSFPEAQGLKVNSRTTCNFSQAENAVVFECVHRLLAQGYLPRHLELEPSWKVGHGNKSGRADVLVKDNQGRAYLIIECKTWGTEFKKAWTLMEADGGQPLSYAQQEKSVQYVALYASHLDPDTGRVAADLHLVRTHDNPPLLEQLRLAHPGHELPTFAGASNAKEMYRAWSETYQGESARRGLFDADTPAFAVGKKNYTLADLRDPGTADTEGKYHEFATILRQHNVAGRENAFDKLVNLFLCKIVDEQLNPTDLKFRWKGRAYDSDFDLQDRLQQLYSAGMKAMLREDVTYITNAQIDDAFRFVRHDPDATRDTIKKYFRELKFFTNNDFAFIDVHNEKLFELNAVVLRKLVELFQEMRVRTDEPNQFLGDLFEGFLDGGVKQSEGQFFTPIPVVRFLLYSLPLAELLAQHPGPLPAIDYACGAGHFLNELALELRALLEAAGHDAAEQELADAGLVGIEKEYRLSKVAKVSAFMYGQQHTEIVHGDGLARHEKTPEGSFRVLVANPPYSVKGFLQTLPEAERQRYALYEGLDKKTLGRNNSIETFFMERAAQLLAPGGVAAIVLPSSVLSNGSQYITAREGLLQAFEIIGIAQLGSRTFGKTGTNTVTLFLRRRASDPAPADHYRHRVDAWFRTTPDGGQAVYADEPLLLAYCRHQGWDPAGYFSLLQGTPSPELLAYELFVDYRRAFDKLPDTKKLVLKIAAAQAEAERPEADEKKRKKKNEDADLGAELHRRWVEYLQVQERNKLYYYVLAAAGPVPGQPPRPVVIIKSPTDNKEQKQFLGYDWSGAKGNEGIQYLTSRADPGPARPRPADEDTADAPDPDETPEALATQSKLATIQTTLYDPLDRANPAKLNTYLVRNFQGEDLAVPEELAPHLSIARLVDMLDFGRIDFDKALSLSPQNTVAAEELATRWDVVKLEDLAEITRGASPRPIDAYMTTAEDGVNWIKIGDVATGAKYITQAAEKVTPAGAALSRLVEPGDFILSNSMSFGRPYILKISGAVHDGWLLLTKFDQRVNRDFLYEILSSDFVQAQFERMASGTVVRNLNIGIVKGVKIPVPPAEVQDALVAACEVVDAETAQAGTTITSAKASIDVLMESVQAAADAEKIDNLNTLLKRGKSTKYGNSAIQVIKSGQARGYTSFAFQEKFFAAEGFIMDERLLQPGDILINSTGTGTAGRVTLFDLPGEFVADSHISIFRTNARILPKFALYCLAQIGFSTIEAMAKGSSGQIELSLSAIGSIKLPLPSLEVQQDTVTAIEDAEAAIAAAQATLVSAPARKQALVRQYLMGPAE